MAFVAAVDPRAWAAPGPSGIRRYVPILTWLPAYDRSFLRFDVIAGATVWGLLVPESIAYAGLAGLPPEAGLYTLLATLTAYAIFGTSRHLVAAATSAAAVLIASGVAAVHPAGAAEYAAAGAAIVLFCGGLFLLAKPFSGSARCLARKRRSTGARSGSSGSAARSARCRPR